MYTNFIPTTHFLLTYTMEDYHYDLNQLINKMIDYPDWTARSFIATHPKLSQSQIDQLVNDKHIFVRRNVLTRSDLTLDQINKLRNDNDFQVQSLATNYIVKSI